jgi:hypothetical protein
VWRVFLKGWVLVRQKGGTVALVDDDVYRWNGCLYVPCHTVRLAAGPFLPVTLNSVEEHLELPSDFQHGLIDRYVGGVRLPRRGLAAARVHGDSMIGRAIFDGDIAIFQRQDFDYVENGKIVVIEKTAEEEGFGAWTLKRLVIEVHRSSYENEYQDEIDWDDPVIVLHSYNPRIRPSQLDPSGQYRVRGIFLRVVPRDEAVFVDSNLIRRRVTGEE